MTNPPGHTENAGVHLLRPNPPPEELPAPVSRTGPVAVALVLLVLAAAILVLRQWRRRRPKVRLSPGEWARQALDEIAKLGLPAAGEIEQFHTRVSDVVRRYLELRFALPASRQTTVEFLETLRESPVLSDNSRAVLQDFLRRCDLVKFARASSTLEQCAELLATARRLLEETTSSESPAVRSCPVPSDRRN